LATVEASTGTDPASNTWSWFIAYIPSAQIASTSSSATVAAIQVKVTYYLELSNRINENVVAYM